MIKKAGFIMIVFGCVFISCKKTYQCECVNSSSRTCVGYTEPAVSGWTQDFSYKAKNADKALSSCNIDHSKPPTTDSGGGCTTYSQTDCKIK